MKKSIMALVLIVILLVPVYAQENMSAWFTEDTITESDQDSLYEVNLLFNEEDAFSSAEFGLVLSEGVTIEELSLGADISSTKIGVTEKDGVYYFGFVDTTNMYSGTVEAFTIKFSSTEAVSTVTIEKATVIRMTESGGAEKEELSIQNSLTLGGSGDTTVDDGGTVGDSEASGDAEDNSNTTDANLEVTVSDETLTLGDGMAELVLFDAMEMSEELITFNDIKTSWAKEEIETLARLDIIHGTSPTTYSPKAFIKRADFVQILMGLIDLDAMDDSQGFSDVKTTAYYYDAVTMAKSSGVVKGTGNNNFEPSSYITRQDMMTIIARFLTKTNVSLEEEADLSGYVDADDISGYALLSVQQLVAKGIIQGNNSNELNPKGNLTREGAARVVYMVYLELYDTE